MSFAGAKERGGGYSTETMQNIHQYEIKSEKMKFPKNGDLNNVRLDIIDQPVRSDKDLRLPSKASFQRWEQINFLLKITVIQQWHP